MFGLNNFTTAGIYFLQIAGELVALFIGITFLVGFDPQAIRPSRKRYSVSNTVPPKGVGNVIGTGFGALTPFCSCIHYSHPGGTSQYGGCLSVFVISFLLASPLMNLYRRASTHSAGMEDYGGVYYLYFYCRNAGGSGIRAAGLCQFGKSGDRGEGVIWMGWLLTHRRERVLGKT